MPQPFVEKPYRAPQIAGAKPTGAKPPNLKRGVLGWVVFIAVAILMFLYISNDPSHLNKAAPVEPFTWIDGILLGMFAFGVLIYIGLIIIGLRLRSVKILSWHFDDAGIHTVQPDGEHFLAWEWIGSVKSVARGIVIDRTVAPPRLLPNKAFSSPAERQAFLDTYARRGVPLAQQVEHDGPRGFDI